MKRIILLLTLVLSLSVFTAQAAQDEHPGYLVKLKENTAQHMDTAAYFSDASLLSDMSDGELCEFISDELETVDDIASRHLVLKAQDEETLQLLVDMGVVEYYEENGYAELLGLIDVEENSYYNNQRWVYDAINADFAFDAGFFGNEVRVGVIDSGAYPHNDLLNNLVEGCNYLAAENTEDRLNTTDLVYHGTFVSGIIASECNSLATVGLACNAKIVPLKVTNSMTNVDIGLIVSAIYDAVDKYNCDVINLSVGVKTHYETIRAAVSHAIQNGAIVVAAAGNSSSSDYLYPAAYDQVVSVANAERVLDSETNEYSYRISRSSTHNNMVDVAAPGTGVYSLMNSAYGVSSKSGTSFSCPLVTASAALLKAVYPDLKQVDFNYYLSKSCDASYITESQNSDYWGKGMLDVKNLLLTAFKYQKDSVYVSDVYDLYGDKAFSVTNMTQQSLPDMKLAFDSSDSSKMRVFPLSVDAEITNTFNYGSLGVDLDLYPEVVTSYVCGDVNGDGEVTNRDASRLMQYLAGWDVEYSPACLDPNGDTYVTNRDASRLMQFVAGWGVELN